MESLTTYMAEQGLVYLVMMAMIIVSSILAGITFYYRITYGTVRKCRFCLSIGKHYDAKPGRECPECGHLHIRKDAWTELDDERVADYKSNYYVNKERAIEQAKLDKEAAEKKKVEDAEQARLKAEQDAAEKKAAEEAAEAEKKRLEAVEQAKIDALRMAEEKQAETIYPGQVVRVIRNRTNAKNPNDDRILAPGDLVQVNYISFKDDKDISHNGKPVRGYSAVYYRRHQGKKKSHFLPLIDVEVTGAEDLLPGRFARVKKTAMHLPHPTDPTKSLPVDTIIRIAGINSDHSAVNYKVAHNGFSGKTGSIDPKWLQLVVDPVDYVQPGDTVRIVRNEVKAQHPGCSKACQKCLSPGDEVIVNSVQRKGTDGWPNKDFDVITYAYPHRDIGMNYLPLYDVEIVEPEPEKFISPVDRSIRGDVVDWNKALDKWHIVPAPDGEYVGLCKRANESNVTVAYYDRHGVLQEAVISQSSAKQVLWPLPDYAQLREKITKEWTDKFFVPRFKAGSISTGVTSPDVEALLPTAMRKKIDDSGGWVPTTTGEGRDFEAGVRKELQQIYELQNC